ncbi:phosphoribosylaminoimidazolesuccinocarboxamide synthase [Hydrogenophilus thermoluteolus]|uniref:Phosphoribosylaminoimidazole-succinocarboxamide synthase n=1 Tax=Hydrogenophilus thermoluteolus TaxID=297 RepID=A0A2Z6DYA4_HYDTE|nr:phosphoribosylaminoimidazolesuccinocarboxamide synthase [Hydrogenophilus thermoluteolus]BBD77504.1 phosphoribosylaminoimidazolesuccinocarboxamide synthase [Hydrogenophilus thermoluteolus]
MTQALYESNLKSLPLIGRGKVRDIYAVGDDKLLVIASDRLSAFDVILPDPIPEKGKILTQITAFWFDTLEGIVADQRTDIAPESVVAPEERDQVTGRAMVVKRLKPLPIEAVVRGYLIGSGWKEYQATGAVCGIPLPEGLRLAEKLPEPIFTPATKAEVGEHDENISFAEAQARCAEALAPFDGAALAEAARNAALTLYQKAHDYALARGVIIADTKFEFGIDEHGTLHLIDEVLTPDSSRFWPADAWQPGTNPPSFDKQFVRDYLESLDWNKQPPAPKLPPEVIEKTRQKYREAYERLTGRVLP